MSFSSRNGQTPRETDVEREDLTWWRERDTSGVRWIDALFIINIAVKSGHLMKIAYRQQLEVLASPGSVCSRLQTRPNLQQSSWTKLSNCHICRRVKWSCRKSIYQALYRLCEVWYSVRLISLHLIQQICSAGIYMYVNSSWSAACTKKK